MCGKGVFFTHNGVGKRGAVIENSGYDLTIAVFTSGKDYKSINTTEDNIEAVLDWDYSIIGNPVLYVPEGRCLWLATAKVCFSDAIGGLARWQVGLW